MAPTLETSFLMPSARNLVPITRLLHEYGSALKQGSAAVFVGAGLSVEAEYPTWKELLRDFARELEIDVEQESDLVGVAQFHINSQGGQRQRIAQLIRTRFSVVKKVPETHRILARLPIGSIWTTNYDRLVERAFELEDKVLEVKRRHNDLTLRNYDAQTVLYKMHGSVEEPESVVIARDDYELYERDRSGFMRVLAAEYIAKTVLFLGLSFTDPNLNYILGLIRAVFQGGEPAHFALMRRPQRAEYDSDSEYEYVLNGFRLWAADMGRYGINVIPLDQYEQIAETLRELENEQARQGVFVSGSFSSDDLVERRKMQLLCRAVGGLLARKGKRLISRLGTVVGTETVAGFVEGLSDRPQSLDRRMVVRPLPKSREGFAPGFREEYRRSMLSQAGMCIVIGGSGGTGSDVKVAQKLGRSVTPIPGTGGTADKIARSILEGTTISASAERDRRIVESLMTVGFSLTNPDGSDIEAIVGILEENLQ